jgi:hypothetical protein
MRHLTYIIIASLLVLSAACKKTGPNPSQSWTIASQVYNAQTCAARGNNAVLASDEFGNTLSCNFFDQLPTSGGTYHVVSNAAAADQVSFTAILTSSSIPYQSTSSGGATVSVTVSNSKVNVYGTNIPLSNGSQTTTLSLNLNQQQ